MLTDKVCSIYCFFVCFLFVYIFFFILTKSAKNHVQKIVDRTQFLFLKRHTLGLLERISHISDSSRRGNKTLGSVTGTLQQIIPGKVPEGDLAICHIPGTCSLNHQILS